MEKTEDAVSGGETMTIIKRSPTELPNVGYRGRKILAVHAWDTGFQELLFWDEEHMKRFCGDGIRATSQPVP